MLGHNHKLCVLASRRAATRSGCDQRASEPKGVHVGRHREHGGAAPGGVLLIASKGGQPATLVAVC